MAPSKFLLGVLMAVGLSSAVPTSSNTIVAQRQEPSMPAVESRGFNGMGPASIIRAVIEYLKPANAYDPSTPDKCVLEFKTTAGGDCMTYVQCKETDSLGSLSNPAVWSQCFVNGKITPA